MFHEYLGYVEIGGSICGLLFAIVVGLIKKDISPLFLSCFAGLFFICVPMLLFCFYEGVSEHIHKERGEPIIQISDVDRVFFNVSSSAPDYASLNNIKIDFNVPDDWYDATGRLVKNVDIEILQTNQAQISFYDLSEAVCKRISREGRMYNGTIVNENSCEKRGEVSVIFGSKSS